MLVLEKLQEYVFQLCLEGQRGYLWTLMRQGYLPGMTCKCFVLFPPALFSKVKNFLGLLSSETPYTKEKLFIVMV